jgi:O-acetyl-ADP-ribose deacetylase (regulator of RNase III)
MHVIQGDLLNLASIGEFDVIVHGCNCHCTMGAGIAAAIKKRFPEAYAADCATLKGDRSKLGTISQAQIERADVRFTLIRSSIGAGMA